MAEPIPIVLVPSLGGSARLYGHQLPALWRSGPVTMADHTRDDSIAAIADRILATSPPRFALAGLSMGGYIAFEMIRQAPNRVARLALLDTSARIDTAAERADRIAQRDAAANGGFEGLWALQFPHVVDPSRSNDTTLQRTFRSMMDDTGADAFVRQQTACLARVESLSTLSAIRCPTLVLVGASDSITSPDHAREMADGIAGSVLVTVPACGHLSTIDRPDDVTRALVAWLSSRTDAPPDAQ